MKENKYYIAGAVILAVSVAVRLISYHIVTADYDASLSHWMAALGGSPGLTAFRSPFSDYPPLYLYFLKLLTYIPIYNLYTIKTLSFLFDLLLGLAVCLIVKKTTRREYSRAQLFFIFAIIVSIPTVVINSSLWGQSDAIYAAFVVLSLYFILRDRPIAASLMFGLALSFKLQAIFFLPVFIGYLLAKRRLWTGIALGVIVYLASLVPAVLGGASFSQLLTVYFNQSREFPALSLSAPNMFSVTGDPGISTGVHGVLSIMGIIAALCAGAVLLVVSARVFKRREGNNDLVPPDTVIFISLLSVIAIPFFLPHMHERYFYLADVMSVLYACVYPRRWLISAIVVTSSLFSYMPFLSGQVALFARLSSNIAYFGILLCVLLSAMLPFLYKYYSESRV